MVEKSPRKKPSWARSAQGHVVEQPLAEARPDHRSDDQLVRLVTAQRGHRHHRGPLPQALIPEEENGVLDRLMMFST